MIVARIVGSQCSVRRLLICLFFVIVAPSIVSRADDGSSYKLATGSTTGSYHKAGVALSTLIKLYLLPDEGIDLTLLNTSGPSANVRALNDDEAQFALVEGLVGHFARHGEGPFADDGRQDRLRAVAALWPRMEHFVVPGSSVVTGTIDDFLALEGQKVSLGRHDTATIASNWVLMANLGVNIEERYDLVFLGHRASAQALVAGEISGMGVSGPLPWGPVEEALVGLDDDADILEFTDEQARKADGGFGVWRRFAIPAGTYAGQVGALWTIAQSNFLAVRDDVPDETVYRITKAIFENLPALQDMDATMKNVTLEHVTEGLPVPFHPGAKRYFQEVGRLPPSRATLSREDDLLRRAPL